MFERYFTSTQLIKSWRLANAIILFVALLLPWIRSWGDIAPYSNYSNGFDALFMPKTLLGVREFVEEYLPGKFMPMLGWSIMEATVPITAIGYSIYCVIVFIGNVPRTTRNSILALFVILFTAYPVWHFSYGIGFNNELSWGYYIVIFGFISSVLLEGYSIFWFRVQQTKSKIPEAG